MKLYPQYEIHSIIAETESSIVYKGYYPFQNNPVILKIFKPYHMFDDAYKRVFSKQAKSLLKVNEPDIVRVKDYHKQIEPIFLVAEYVEGKTLKELLKTKSLPKSVNELIPLFLKMIDALANLHKYGICHSDLKPSNFIFDQDFNVKLTTYGFAKTKYYDELFNERMKQGDALYLHYNNYKHIPTFSDDIYCLGMIFYEMLTGRLPFDKTDINSWSDYETAFNNEKRPHPIVFNSTIPFGLNAIIMRCIINKDHEPLEFQTAKALKAAILAEYPITILDTFPEKYSVEEAIERSKKNVNNKLILETEWCKVPAGKFLFGEHREERSIDYDYEIMKYPVTNRQFLRFIKELLNSGKIMIIEEYFVFGYYEGDEQYEAGIYRFMDLECAGHTDWATIDWDESDFRIDDKFLDHPVINVSWFGAHAFVKHYGLHLPTVEEWERAARGDSGLEYTWGNQFEENRATFDQEFTTPVDYYNGKNGTKDTPSPYGAYDMLGNVYEWTNSFLEKDRLLRILCGCSYYEDYDESELLKTWNYGYEKPYLCMDDFGLRCVRKNV